MYRNNKTISILKSVFSIFIIYILGLTSVIFSVLYAETFDSGFIKEYSHFIISVLIAMISALTMLSVMFFANDAKLLYKLFIIIFVLISVIVGVLYILKIMGCLDKMDSVNDIRNFIISYGKYAAPIFILIQFLQVVVLPIPSFVTVAAGVLLFGPLKGSIYSCTGIICGSIAAFAVGRVLGVKAVKWLVGENSLNKCLNTIKGKDKIILTFMFLFPFFPDDVLCFVAGMTTMSHLFFVIMIFITRIISVFVSSYSMNNSLIPYDTWWGIIIWVVFFVLTTIFTMLIYKKGDRLEEYVSKKFLRCAKH